jgi:hypothetical protein
MLADPPFCLSTAASILAMDALQIRSIWRASVPLRAPETFGHAAIRAAIRTCRQALKHDPRMNGSPAQPLA